MPNSLIKLRFSPSLLGRIVLIGLIFASLSLLSACDLLQPQEVDPSIRETQLELNVQQTLSAQQATEQGASSGDQVLQTSQAADKTAQALQPPTIDPAQAAQATIEAGQSTQAAQQTALVTQAAARTPEPSPTTQVDLTERIQSANILLYEDMVNNLDTNRYILDTLKSMGISCEQDGSTPCKDDGSAKGWLKSDLTGLSPSGQPWDLVIISAETKQGDPEAKSNLPGEFFGDIMNILNQDIPVILETGNLDMLYGGAAAQLLSRCGVAWENNWIKVPTSRMVMFPLAGSHPVLNEPNPGLSFTDVTSFWTTTSKTKYYDLGDWLKISGSGATLLVGTNPSDAQTHGTVVICSDDHLILQTFSSHQLTFNAMKPVWENYIYNMLKVRFLGSL